MSTLLDIFGSVVIAGMLFMMIIKLNLFSKQTSYTSDNELKVIQNTKTLAEILEYDLRKIGYRSTQAVKFKEAKITEVEFYSDIDRDSTNLNDVVRYWVQPSSEPGYLILKRTINNGSEMSGPSLGLDSLKFTYFDSSGDSIKYSDTNSNLDKIRYIKTELWVTSSYAVRDAFSNDSTFSKTYWEFTINPRNL
jgi:hypothetical protein